MTDAALPEPAPPAEAAPGLARNASILSLGNIASRVLGFLRDAVMSRLFGSEADALALALAIPIQIYDLVTGGLVNSALVPAFSEYTPEARRAELWRLASTVLTLAAAVISALTALLVLLAPQVIAVFGLIGGQAAPDVLATAAGLLRITLPAVVFLSLSGILTGLLYALRRFTLPAFTGAVFNASMVAVSLLLAGRLGVAAMALGLLIGAALQVLLQLPALPDGLRALRPQLALEHPGLRRIFRLYVPIIISLVITQVSIYLGLGLAFGFAGGLSWMRYATTLYQFPLGLVAVAVSSAILPTLAGQAAGTLAGDFKTTLVQGLNLVLLLMVPATVGLFVLAEPIVGLVFAGGRFTPEDTLMTAAVLRVFLLGLSFAAVDQLLIFAFYARHDTLTPSSVGVLSVGVYIVTALAARPTLGLFSLMLADSVKQITHALVTGTLLSRRLGGFQGTGLWPALGKILLAAGVMGLAVAGADRAVSAVSAPGLWQDAARVAGAGLLGVLVYFGLAAWLRVAEVRVALELLRRRLRV
ncbi:MAG: murein biosynthesis integral membrane protein MurJ [Anaerolineales bacterium]|nr:murein biosynthesis integral membrane protein MurJ [Anaerolineales bacterium]